MIQLAKLEGPSEQREAKKNSRLALFPLVPKKAKQRNSEIKGYSANNGGKNPEKKQTRK